jgi:hypothetical protein
VNFYVWENDTAFSVAVGGDWEKLGKSGLKPAFSGKFKAA